MAEKGSESTHGEAGHNQNDDDISLAHISLPGTRLRLGDSTAYQLLIRASATQRANA